jgi:hypothetical protein
MSYREYYPLKHDENFNGFFDNLPLESVLIFRRDHFLNSEQLIPIK